MNADILIDFMKRLVKDAAGKKVFLILDDLKVHHARPVKAWLADHADTIEVFYLPSYSLELERLNADLKAVVTRKAPARAKGDLKKAAIGHLRRLQKSPQRVRRYFQPRFVIRARDDGEPNWPLRCACSKLASLRFRAD
jgi:hypothetical protein